VELVVTDFIYDCTGHLQPEASHSTGITIREYISMGDKPVALSKIAE
jgi:hypothetical protein